MTEDLRTVRANLETNNRKQKSGEIKIKKLLLSHYIDKKWPDLAGSCLPDSRIRKFGKAGYPGSGGTLDFMKLLFCPIATEPKIFLIY